MQSGAYPARKTGVTGTREAGPQARALRKGSPLNSVARGLAPGLGVRAGVARGKILSVEPPTFVVLQVTNTSVAVRGDTATNIQKDITLETGAVIKAPAFVEEGDLVRIDTRSGEYVDRTKK